MMVNENAEALATARPRWLKRDVKGLLWKEWLEHGGLLTAFLSVWLVCGWVLLIFNHPGWLLAFGICYTLLAGPAFGGAGAAEGSEEFSFSLPPTRGKQYFVRLAAGGAPLILFLALGLLAVGLDLPQRVWRLFVETGLTEPFPDAEQSYLYALALTFPLAVFALAFAFAALATSRTAVAWSGGLAANHHHRAARSGAVLRGPPLGQPERIRLLSGPCGRRSHRAPCWVCEVRSQGGREPPPDEHGRERRMGLVAGRLAADPDTALRFLLRFPTKSGEGFG